MDLVFDVLVADSLDFTLPRAQTAGHPSMEEAARSLCVQVGLELIDYETFQVIRCGDQQTIQLRGRKWIDRQMR